MDRITRAMLVILGGFVGLGIFVVGYILVWGAVAKQVAEKHPPVDYKPSQEWSDVMTIGAWVLFPVVIAGFFVGVFITRWLVRAKPTANLSTH